MSYRAYINSISLQIDEDLISITSFVFAFHVTQWSRSSVRVEMEYSIKWISRHQSRGGAFGGALAGKQIPGQGLWLQHQKELQNRRWW
jgi:hypothetical protein